MIAQREDVRDCIDAADVTVAQARVPANERTDHRDRAEDARCHILLRERPRLELVQEGEPAIPRDVSADPASAREHEVVGEDRLGRPAVTARDRSRPFILAQAELVFAQRASLRSTNRRTASCGSSVAIERASQSRAWLIVSCQARSFQKFRCCFA